MLSPTPGAYMYAPYAPSSTSIISISCRDDMRSFRSQNALCNNSLGRNIQKNISLYYWLAPRKLELLVHVPSDPGAFPNHTQNLIWIRIKVYVYTLYAWDETQINSLLSLTSIHVLISRARHMLLKLIACTKSSQSRIAFSNSLSCSKVEGF